MKHIERVYLGFIVALIMSIFLVLCIAVLNCIVAYCGSVILGILIVASILAVLYIIGCTVD